VINIKKIIIIIIISSFYLAESNAVIKDSLYATVGDKAITHSDIINEIKIMLILNNQSFSEEKKEYLQSVAIRSVIKINIKKIAIEKYDLELSRDEVDKQLKKMASNLNMNFNTFKNIFTTNEIDFSIVTDQVQTELLWNSLIFQLYKDRLSINLSEIDEQLKLIERKKEVNEYLISEIIIKPIPKDELESEIQKLKNRIKIEGFETVAMDLSISETALQGGDLGWVNENIIAEKLKYKIVSTPIGSVSEPIFLPEGMLFFKVRDKRKSSKFTSLEEAKNELIDSEKKKILNMHSLSHYNNLKRSISINYY